MPLKEGIQTRAYNKNKNPTSEQAICNFNLLWDPSAAVYSRTVGKLPPTISPYL